MSAIHREIQEHLREELVRSLGRHRFRLWFRDARVADVGAESLTLAVPTDVHRTWLECTYGPVLRDAVEHVLGPGVGIRVEVREAEGELRRIRERLPQGPAEWQAALERHAAAPSFDGFVVAPSRRFPLLLLQQLAQGGEVAGGAPLYLCGPEGSGKSHLLRAFEADVGRRRPGECLHLSARRFTQRYVTALRARDVGALRAFETDLANRRFVLIDDVDELVTRPATQAELARLLDDPGATRFVLAGRAPPSALDGLSQRLRSRLSSGVLLALERPGPEERRALLLERARATGFTLPEDVLDAVVARSTTLAAAVQQVDRWAVASRCLGEPLGARWLDEVAPGLAASTREDVVRRAKDAVARHFAIDRDLLDRPTKARHAAFPRRVAIYLVYRACPLPLSDLGASFGLRSHSSVSRAVTEMREARLKDPSLEQTLDGLLASL